ncbi:hypothetical protein [Mesorhizobium sp. M7A.F.Ca.US.011.01.1.1]|nr:hypothetical protein [Mesorhizobium sp. M7A.F.Ca.US.011.01.1.1]
MIGFPVLQAGTVDRSGAIEQWPEAENPAASERRIGQGRLASAP